MKNKICISLLLFVLISFSKIGFAQDLSAKKSTAIVLEIDKIFEKSIVSAEKLNFDEISEVVCDTFKAGFINQGKYYKNYIQLLEESKQGAERIEYQNIEIENKKITVLSETVALLTASGRFEAKISGGPVISGLFTWSFVYAKKNNSWKLVHSHMSNP